MRTTTKANSPRGPWVVAALVLLHWLGLGTAQALLPNDDAGDLEISLPFQEDNLAYGDQAAPLASPGIGSSIGERIGGQWWVHSWNRRSKSPHYIFGSGADVAPAIAGASDAETAARSVLGQNAEALSVDVDQLRLDGVRQGSGKSAVHFQQTYEGLDVIGGRAHATFLDATGRVFVMGADFYSIEGLDITTRIAQGAAERIAIDALPQRERSISQEPGEETHLYVLPYPTSLETFEPRLVWKVTVVTDGRTGVFENYVDAQTGQILWRHNDVHYVNYIGTINGDAENNTWCNGDTRQPMKYMHVSISGGGSTDTDANGNWTISNGDNSARTASTSFFGPFCDVNRASGGSDAVQQGTAFPGVSRNFLWLDGNCRQDERDVFDAISDIHDFFETFDPGYSYTNNRITANVGVSGTCNAFWNGSINFYDAGSGCANSGEVQGVVDHEFGHGVQNNLIGGQGDEGLGEGNGDVLANFMTDESLLGRGFFLSCVTGIRNSDNIKQYPEDLVGDPHGSGGIIAGVMWDARVNLQNSLGAAAGKAQAAVIWHFGRKLERPSNQPDQCLSMFIADDDNGNLGDGTPHFNDICAAVSAHDTNRDAFDCPDPGTVWVDFSNSGSEDGTMEHPYNSAFQAQQVSQPGYFMKLRPGASTETGTLSKPGKLQSFGGSVRIGAP